MTLTVTPDLAGGELVLVDLASGPDALSLKGSAVAQVGAGAVARDRGNPTWQEASGACDAE